MSNFEEMVKNLSDEDLFSQQVRLRRELMSAKRPALIVEGELDILDAEIANRITNNIINGGKGE